MEKAHITALSTSPAHTMQKQNQLSVNLIKGIGIEGDAHAGKKVKHRSRVRRDPSQPNLRQVHLIHSELFDELEQKGFNISAGQMGENITTSGIDLLALPTHTILHLGNSAKIKVTGLRNPCTQLDGIQKGLMAAVLDKDVAGNLIRKAGIMGVVLGGGHVKVGDTIRIEFPELPHKKLEKV